VATSKINPSGTTKLDTQRILERGERIREGTDKPWDVIVQESSLYDLKPTMRAVLVLLARSRVQGDGPNARPNHPSRKALPQGEYENWCWFNQKTIADRVGCVDRYVRDCIKRFVADDVVEVREWRDDLGHAHLEYKVNIQTVKLHQRKEGEPRAKRYSAKRKPNDGSFSTANQPSHRNSQPLGSDDKSGDKSVVSHRNSQPSPTGTLIRRQPEVSTETHRNSQPQATGTECRGLGDVGLGLNVSDSSSGLQLQTPPSGGDGSLRSPGPPSAVSSPASQENKKTLKATPHGFVSKTEEQPPKRKRCAQAGCKGLAAPGGTQFCSWHDRERAGMGKKPPTYDQMPNSQLRVAGLGEELEIDDADRCSDCGELDGHKPRCPQDIPSRAQRFDGEEDWNERAVRHARDTEPGRVLRHRMQVFPDYDDEGKEIPRPRCANAPDCNHYECQ
jgi:hypothetical protein